MADARSDMTHGAFGLALPPAPVGVAHFPVGVAHFSVALAHSTVGLAYSSVALAHSKVALAHSQVALAHSPVAVVHSVVAVVHSFVAVVSPSVGLVSASVALVSASVALVSASVALVSASVALVSRITALVARKISLVGRLRARARSLVDLGSTRRPFHSALATLAPPGCDLVPPLGALVRPARSPGPSVPSHADEPRRRHAAAAPREHPHRPHRPDHLGIDRGATRHDPGDHVRAPTASATASARARGRIPRAVAWTASLAMRRDETVSHGPRTHMKAGRPKISKNC